MRKLIANKKKRKMAMSWEKISEGEEEGEKSRVERPMQGKRYTREKKTGRGEGKGRQGKKT